MPVDFLTPTQRQRYGRYPDSLPADELARNFHLDDKDRECIANKRRDCSRLGFALQLATVLIARASNAGGTPLRSVLAIVTVSS
jgi:hypothetical protein